MRIASLIVAVSLFVVSTAAAQTPRELLVGKWNNKNKKDTLEFTKDGKFVIEERVGGGLQGKYTWIDLGTIEIEARVLNDTFKDKWKVQVTDSHLTMIVDGEDQVYFRVGGKDDPKASKLPGQLIGKWENVKDKKILDFREDGSVGPTFGKTVAAKNRGMKYRWLGADSIEITTNALGNPTEAKFVVKIDGDTLTLDDKFGKVDTYKRVAAAPAADASPKLEDVVVGKWENVKDKAVFEFRRDGSLSRSDSKDANSYRVLGSDIVELTSTHDGKSTSTKYKIAATRDVLSLDDRFGDVMLFRRIDAPPPKTVAKTAPPKVTTPPVPKLNPRVVLVGRWENVKSKDVVDYRRDGTVRFETPKITGKYRWLDDGTIDVETTLMGQPIHEKTAVTVGTDVLTTVVDGKTETYRRTFVEPKLVAAERVVRRLPDSYSDFCLGGDGRYMIFHLARLKKLAFFDIGKAEIVRYLPLDDDSIAFAAGSDSLIVGLKKANKLLRYNLETLELEKVAPNPLDGGIGHMVMGHGSKGPVVVNNRAIDVATLKLMPLVHANGHPAPSLPGLPSADGRVYAAWHTRQSPVMVDSHVIHGGTVHSHGSGDLKHCIPGPDGRSIYTARGITTESFQRTNQEDERYGWCLPAVRGDHFLAIAPPQAGKPGRFVVYVRGLRDAIGAIDQTEIGFDGWDREDWGTGPWRRVFLAPEEKAIAVLPGGNDQVVLYKFDPTAALEKSDLDYLLVTSRPTREVKAGSKFTYPIQVKSKQGGVGYRLDSGPDGMTVSKDGVVSWAVPADELGVHHVLARIHDKIGQETFHAFSINVAK